MTTSVAQDAGIVSIALLGNPNTGKSTLFSALCGVRQRTGNYPGVTVEKKTGRMQHAGRAFDVIDLPGTYSLAPRSPDEMIAVDILLGRLEEMPRPQVVLVIVDASNLERNFYLVGQILELGLPVVLAVNMIDLAASKGITFDTAALAERLGIAVVPVQANRGTGIPELKAALAAAVDSPAPVPKSPFPAAFQDELTKLHDSAPQVPRYLIERMMLDAGGFLLDRRPTGVSESLQLQVRAARLRLEDAKCPIPGIEAISRYRWVGETLKGVVTRAPRDSRNMSDRIDGVLTHRLWGSAIFLLLMMIMFQMVFFVADPSKAAFAWFAEHASSFIEAFVGTEGPLRSLLIDGVIAGVGGVVTFLPQILVLFLFLGILEDCGYMARAAYLMDRIMSRVGLSGKSFIPLLSSFACAIPGIMGTRVIEHPRDRLITILIAPLMSCSARIPVYVLMASTFIPQINFLGGWLSLPTIVILAMYLLGLFAAGATAFVLKRSILPGKTPPFVLELPGYKIPSFGNVVWRMLDRGWAFVSQAGTLILAVSVLVWAAGYYPRHPAAISAELRAVETEQTERLSAATEGTPQHKEAEASLRKTQNAIASAYLSDSYLGRIGRGIEPVVRPLGWDWRIGCAAVASFPAREVIVATLGTIFSLGSEVDAESKELQDIMKNAVRADGVTPLFNVPVALSVMVFFSLCAQCVSTLAAIRRETNSWRWPVFTFAYMTVLAYVAALIAYQGGMMLGWDRF